MHLEVEILNKACPLFLKCYSSDLHLMLSFDGSVRLPSLLVRILEKVQFKRYLLVFQWRREELV